MLVIVEGHFYVMLGFMICSVYLCFVIVSWQYLVSHVLNMFLRIVLWVVACLTQHTDKQGHKRGKGRHPLVVERKKKVMVKPPSCLKAIQLRAKADERQIFIDAIP